MTRPLALVIDDEPDICELLNVTLDRMDINTETATDVRSAKEKFANHKFDLCLTDMRLPDGNGLELVEWMQTNASGVPVAVITAHGNIETAVQALKLGAFDFISKPLDLQNLRNIVRSALKLGEAGSDAGSRLLGDSPTMQELREMVAKVARSQAPVHISGESGTGKELVARLIHDSGPRKDGPFVPVNCGAIPTELMESEFFGHRKGSFTGAVRDKVGLVETANSGTLFLDEIADLPLAMQVKLLRVIQEKTVRPVGSSKEEPVDARILSATHRTLADMVANGDFREDLYHILERLGSADARLEESAKSALMQYPFPGNVRELENMLERAVTLCPTGTITESDLHLRPMKSEDSDEPPLATGTDLGDHIEDVQRQAIVDALEKTRYNKTAAAKLLGLSFRQLRYRIKKLGID